MKSHLEFPLITWKRWNCNELITTTAQRHISRQCCRPGDTPTRTAVHVFASLEELWKRIFVLQYIKYIQDWELGLSTQLPFPWPGNCPTILRLELLPPNRESLQAERGGNTEAAAQEPPPLSNPVHQTLCIAIFSLCHTLLHWQTDLHLAAPTQSTAHSRGKELWKLSKPTANNSPSHEFSLNNSNCFHSWNGFHFSEQLSTKNLVCHQSQPSWKSAEVDISQHSHSHPPQQPHHGSPVSHHTEQCLATPNVLPKPPLTHRGTRRSFNRWPECWLKLQGHTRNGISSLKKVKTCTQLLECFPYS